MQLCMQSFISMKTRAKRALACLQLLVYEALSYSPVEDEAPQGMSGESKPVSPVISITLIGTRLKFGRISSGRAASVCKLWQERREQRCWERDRGRKLHNTSSTALAG
jgi:hypothetical protein